MPFLPFSPYVIDELGPEDRGSAGVPTHGYRRPCPAPAAATEGGR